MINSQKLSKFKSVASWIGRHVRTIIILGMLVVFAIILMSHGEGFLEAVKGSYILVSYFLSQNGSSQSDDSLAIVTIIIILVALAVILIPAFIKPKSKK